MDFMMAQLKIMASTSKTATAMAMPPNRVLLSEMKPFIADTQPRSYELLEASQLSGAPDASFLQQEGGTRPAPITLAQSERPFTPQQRNWRPATHTSEWNRAGSAEQQHDG